MLLGLTLGMPLGMWLGIWLTETDLDSWTGVAMATERRAKKRVEVNASIVVEMRVIELREVCEFDERN